MTPKIWNKVGALIENNERLLVFIGLSSLAILFISLGFIFFTSSKPGPIVLLPILVLFFCGGLGLVRLQFKTKIDKANKSIDQYMKNASTSECFMLWYGSIFVTFWLAGVAIMSIAIVAKYLK